MDVDIAVGEMRQRVEPAEFLFGRRAESLAGQLAETPTADRPALIRETLRARSLRRHPSRVSDAIRALERADPAGTLTDVVNEMGSSRSTLWRRATAALGMTAQLYLMLRRFEQGADVLAAGCPIAEAAARAGYVDQAHFHRQVRRFTGLTPGQLQRRADATYVQDGDSRRPP